MMESIGDRSVFDQYHELLDKSKSIKDNTSRFIDEVITTLDTQRQELTGYSPRTKTQATHCKKLIKVVEKDIKKFTKLKNRIKNTNISSAQDLSKIESRVFVSFKNTFGQENIAHLTDKLEKNRQEISQFGNEIIAFTELVNLTAKNESAKLPVDQKKIKRINSTISKIKITPSLKTKFRSIEKTIQKLTKMMEEKNHVSPPSSTSVEFSSVSAGSSSSAKAEPIQGSWPRSTPKANQPAPTIGVNRIVREVEVQAIQRRTMEENVQALRTEFKQGLFIRTFSDATDEYENTVKPKLQIEHEPHKIDKRYWASTSSLQEGVKLPVWDPTKDRTGLFISHNVEIGGWNAQDMGTDSPQKEWEDERIKNHFPKNFPPIAFTQLFEKIENQDPKVIRQVLGLEENTPITNVEADNAQQFLIDAMEPEHPDHPILRDRVPEYVSSYDIETIQQKMRGLKDSDKVLSNYTEAKIHYKPNDILGIYVSRSEGSIAKAKAMQENLSKDGINVPLVSYDPSTGTIEIVEY